ncbi:hypothetical protein AZI86_18265 [Bdellovibrio bacteriovorus]|uniref:Lipoprotein n=1 Tax=Bdellovibrio bacteriovorus TaxID=959 RepID=A0A150WF99_BDEBC|nr:hypothetical protein [Bdellovibrio bacteriovorus]KYG61644.1 hypothetical protein AZI86_18265 [Bdellovibrio bacteriovorus]
MMKFLLIGMVSLVIGACATHESRPMPWADVAKDGKETSVSPSKTTSKTTSTSSMTTVKTSISVGPNDLRTLEKMDKALEGFVLRNETKIFTSLCKEKRFDCYVGDVLYPKTKKKVSRKVPPYASGSKMGLQGENRIQARYDFYP